MGIPGEEFGHWPESSFLPVLRESEAQRGQGTWARARDPGFLCRAFSPTTLLPLRDPGAILRGWEPRVHPLGLRVTVECVVIRRVGCSLAGAGQGGWLAGVRQLTAPPAAPPGPAGNPSAPTPSPHNWRPWCRPHTPACCHILQGLPRTPGLGPPSAGWRRRG